MSCFHPLDAWQTEGGQIVFAELGAIRRQLQLPCGRCIGCRLSRARSWAIRCVHEASLHDSNAFLTLTYDGVLDTPSLVYRDFQLFMKRLRRARGPTRFFACGEYGDEGLRPHFHALLFGTRFADQVRHDKKLFRSRELERLWPHGFASIGQVTFQSAAYVARYAVKKVSGPSMAEHYSRVDLSTGEIVVVEPEMAHMSLNPGIGMPWFDRFWRDVYLARDGVVIDGKLLPSPKFYDRMLERVAPDLRSDKEADRYFASKQFEADCTPARLADREIVAKARLKVLKRSL